MVVDRADLSPPAICENQEQSTMRNNSSLDDTLELQNECENKNRFHPAATEIERTSCNKSIIVHCHSKNKQTISQDCLLPLRRLYKWAFLLNTMVTFGDAALAMLCLI